MTALLLDEMLSGAIAQQLRDREINAVAVIENAELVGGSDEDLLAHTAMQGQALVTANVADFAALARDWRATAREHAGLIYVTYRRFPQNRSFIGAVVAAIASCEASGTIPGSGMELFLRRT